jgi:hypothetical protein
MVASSSLGISDATTRTNSMGCVHAAVISAGLPKACHASQRSRKNLSLSLLREPFGRPLGRCSAAPIPRGGVGARVPDSCVRARVAPSQSSMRHHGAQRAFGLPHTRCSETARVLSKNRRYIVKENPLFGRSLNARLRYPAPNSCGVRHA